MRRAARASRLKMSKEHLEPSAQPDVRRHARTRKCLYAYPLDEWQPVRGGIYPLNCSRQSNVRRDRFFARTLMQWSEEVHLDTQFRLLVPKAMMDFAEIEKEVFFIGVLDHIELWKPENFKKYIESKKDTYEKVVGTCDGKSTDE